ncbi:hypothetical protein CR513_41781, partial [Mucuna pruriens]
MERQGLPQGPQYSSNYKSYGPVVQVLRVVDEKKPAMSYIYEAMDRAKEAIQNAFKGNEDIIKNDLKVTEGLYKCTERLFANEEVHKVSHESSISKRQEAKVAIRQRTTLAPST